jgi:hypothetical protein
MHHNEFITADLAFRDYVRVRSDEQDFYEAFGRQVVVPPALTYAVAVFRTAFCRLGKEARDLHLASRTYRSLDGV